MATDASEETDLQKRLKSALWFSLGKIVDEESLRFDVNATPQFIAAFSMLVWTQIVSQENVSRDLESFAKHAGRRTINVDDVMLLSRRNEGLETLMREFLDERSRR
ncbi:hypothetical protein FGG08_004366 [Glutinoglossum americanum]|uniref:Centromere protein S n=1 Tax=Glutinoglossum americanum TaxID=1670608 RepID=A0A9P8KZM1_9PEZI|nr:hypothetical protein FGG08_004366 [Glutinoglossum americanum]